MPRLRRDRYRTLIKTPTTMKTLILTFLLLTTVPGFLGAAQNPFEKADDDLYTGRFKGQDVILSLKPEGGKWSGTLVFKGSSYSIKGEQKDGRYRGTSPTAAAITLSVSRQGAASLNSLLVASPRRWSGKGRSG